MASAAGTPVDDACVLKYKDLKSKRKYKFVTYKIENNSIVVATEGAPTASFDDFIEALPESEPRYVEAHPPPPHPPARGGPGLLRRRDAGWRLARTDGGPLEQPPRREPRFSGASPRPSPTDR